MKIKIILTIGILAITATALFIILSSVSKDSGFSVSGGNLEITGSFGVTVSISEIHNLGLKDTMPDIGKKTNGSGLGSKYKGEFDLSDGSKARLYVDASKPPFITFTNGDTVFYINMDTPEKTRELYEQIDSAVK